MTRQKIKRKINANNRLIHRSGGQKDFIFGVENESKDELKALLLKQEEYMKKAKEKKKPKKKKGKCDETETN